MNLYASPAISQRAQFRPTSFVNSRRASGRQIPRQVGTRFAIERDHDFTSQRLTPDVANTSDEANTPTVEKVREAQLWNPTPTVDEVAIPTPVPKAKLSVTERLANERMVLLARQYAKGPNPQETELRLAIITQRILTLVPRVTKDHVNALELITREITETEAGLVERARRRAELRGGQSREPHRVQSGDQGSERIRR